MKIDISYIVTRKDGRRTVRDKRCERIEVGAEYLHDGNVTEDGRALIMQLLELRAKLAGGDQISALEVGMDLEKARELRAQRAEMACYEHLRRENCSSARVRALEAEYRQLHGLKYYESIGYEGRQEIEMAFRWNRPFDRPQVQNT